MSARITINLGLDGGWHDFALDVNRLAFWVPEARQGKTDLNGDGDAGDDVMHLVDLSLAQLDPVVQIRQLIADVGALNLQYGLENIATIRVCRTALARP